MLLCHPERRDDKSKANYHQQNDYMNHPLYCTNIYPCKQLRLVESNSLEGLSCVSQIFCLFGLMVSSFMDGFFGGFGVWKWIANCTHVVFLLFLVQEEKKARKQEEKGEAKKSTKRKDEYKRCMHDVKIVAPQCLCLLSLSFFLLSVVLLQCRVEAIKGRDGHCWVLAI